MMGPAFYRLLAVEETQFKARTPRRKGTLTHAENLTTNTLVTNTIQSLENRQELFAMQIKKYKINHKINGSKLMLP